MDPAGDARAVEIRRTRVVGFITLALVLLVTALWEGDRLRENLFDLYQRLQPRTIVSVRARIVEIDEVSLARYGPWPWPRSRLARLAQDIFARRALAIGFDMIFAEVDRNSAAQFLRNYAAVPPNAAAALAALPDPDQRFAATIGRLPVVLVRAGVGGGKNAGNQDPAKIPIAALFTGNPAPSGLLSFPKVITNLPALDEAAAGHAVLNGPPDADGILRRVPIVALVGGRPTPSLALEMLRVATDADGYRLETDGPKLTAVTIGDRRIPTEADGRLRLRFSARAARTVSAASVLDGTLPPGTFRNSVVFIGASALGLTDIVATPLVAESFGVDVHAQAVEAIIDQAWLVRPSWARGIEIMLAVALGVIAVAILPGLRPAWVFVCGGGVIVFVAVASLAAFAINGLLLDPVTPGLGGGLVTWAMLCRMLVAADRQRQALRVTLVEERVQTAHIAGELEAARKIQSGMLPNRESLDALPRAIDLAAVLEPASAVGGDLYDAFMLEDGRLFFMIGDVTGKGVPASLFMALSKALTKSAVLRGRSDLEASVMTAHAEISRENHAEMFVTAVFGLLEIETGFLQLVNAGHDNPVVLRVDRPPGELVLDGGPPLCVMEDFPYAVESVTLGVGDLLVLTTDGVTEARDPTGELFGRARLMATLDGFEQPANAHDAVLAVTRTVRAFEAGEDATDDLTILAIKYRGTEVDAGPPTNP